ncbi:MAG TPA: glycosyltransferase family 4 protein [Gemmataceae bacterium]|nr:glycosyltransferase family 4 protein [Gemmataceae bacterium]
MKIAYITAGAAGSFCGSCMHDNTLVAALLAQGHEALLIPTYTPIRTDEPDVSYKRVFFGGINVYLQQKISLFRYTPWLLDRPLDSPGLLRWVSRFAVQIEASKLGELTVSVLQGEHGHQRKEVAKLVHWLATEVRPEIVCLTNVLLSGMVPEMKHRLGVPVLAALQGDDIFLEGLPEPYRGQALALIRDHCRLIDGFLASSAFYADFMAAYLSLPREHIHVVHPGIDLRGHGGPQPAPSPLPLSPSEGERGRGEGGAVRDGPPYTIGYLARVCPEKGLHVLVEAFRLLRQSPDAPPCRLRVSGWLGKTNLPYFDDLRRRLAEWGLADQFEYVAAPDHVSKVRFLQSLDVLSVPTVYREPKGLYVLEALANGVPVVQPRHGSFPELIEATGGGLLVNPNDPSDLARGLRQLLEDPAHRAELGRKGKEAVQQKFNADVMARRTIEVFRKYLP